MGFQLKLSDEHRIIKNLLAINIAFFLQFSANNSITSVQSVLNKTENLGLVTLVVGYAVQLAFGLVFPVAVVKIIGFKRSMVMAQVFYTLLIAANAYPRWYTMIPGAVFVGLAQSLAWTILGIYILTLSKNYAECTKLLRENVQYLFFAMFTAILLASNAFGSILIATVLKTEDMPSNSSFDYTRYCGANNCPADILPSSSTTPSKESVYILVGILVTICVIGIINTICFMDNIPMITDKKENDKKMSILQKFTDEIKSICKLFTCLDVYLLLPLSIFSGFESFIACLTSVNYIGWTNILFGLAGGLFSLIFGYLARYTTIVPQIIITFCLSMGHAVFILAWTPEPETGSYVIFLMTLVLAVTESIATVQIRGLYGLQFPKAIDSAQSIASVSQVIGFIIGLACSLFMCTRIKTYVYFGISFLSLLTYTIMFSRNNYRQMKIGDENHVISEDDIKI